MTWFLAKVVIIACAVSLMVDVQVASAQVEVPLPTRFRTIQAPYHVVSTDLPPEDAQEATLRLSRLAEELAERTKGYGGRVTQRLPVVLFKEIADYHAAGGPKGTGGFYQVRNGRKRLLVTIGAPGDPNRWRVLHHETFHQFIDAAIGDVPTWIDEGLAEYFGEGVWTGDSFLTGFIPPERMALLRQRMDEKRLLSAGDMIRLKPEQWNAMMSATNYHQAWSMAHFLAHGDNGKYQAAFAAYMRALGRKQSPEKAWTDSFGAAEGFEQKWTKWWSEIPPDPTAELYTRATLSTFASFVARAYAQQKTYPSLEDLASAVKIGEVRLTGESWLPLGLLEEAIQRSKRDGTTYTIEPAKVRGGAPTVVAVRPDGGRFVAVFPPKLAVPVKVSITYTAGALKLPGAETNKPPTATTRPSNQPPVPSQPVASATQPSSPAIPATRPTSDPPVAAKGPSISPNGVNPNGDRYFSPLVPGREKALDFVVENCVFGKDHKMVTDIADVLNTVSEQGGDAYILIGSKLLKTRRNTIVLLYRGRSFIIEVTDAQAAQLDMKPASTRSSQYKIQKEIRDEPTIEFVQPALFSPVPANNVDLIRWGMRYTRVASKDPVTIRMRSFFPGNVYETGFTYLEPVVVERERGNIRMKMFDIKRSTPVLVVFEAVHAAQDSKDGIVHVISEPQAVLVDVEVQE